MNIARRPTPESSDGATGEHQRSAGLFLVAAAGVAVAWVIFQLGWMTGHVFDASRFILGDQGSYLYAIGRWQAGEVIYRDFAWQYGPLALGWYRAFAAIGGNTPLMLVLASSVAFAIAWVLVARLAVLVAGRLRGGLLAVAALLPVMSASGPTTLNGPHGSIEMLLLSGCAWMLAANKNGRARPWILGILTGLLQWVRFGPHAVAMIAVLLLVAWQSWPEAGGGRDFLRKTIAFAGRFFTGYILTIAPLAVWYFVALPAPGAKEQLWPAFMVAHYDGSYAHRWPQISSLAEFALRWLPALVGVILVLVRLAAGFGSRQSRARVETSSAEIGLMFFPLYYLIGCALLFRNDYAITGYLWLAWPGLALAAGIGRRWWQGAVMATVAPAVLVVVAGVWSLAAEERDWRSRPLPLPNGQQLWFHGGEARRFGQLQDALGPQAPSQHLAVFFIGGGIHHFFGTQRAGRHWWFLPEFVRPWEEEKAWQALLRHDFVLIATRENADKGLTLWLPLPRTMGERLVPHLRNPRHIDAIGELLQVVP